MGCFCNQIATRQKEIINRRKLICTIYIKFNKMIVLTSRLNIYVVLPDNGRSYLSVSLPISRMSLKVSFNFFFNFWYFSVYFYSTFPISDSKRLLPASLVLGSEFGELLSSPLSAEIPLLPAKNLAFWSSN